MAGTADPTNVGPSGNVWMEGILWGTRWDSPGARTVVQTYIAGQGGDEAINLQGTDVTATVPYARERAAMIASMNLIEQVCNIDFQLVSSQAQADLIWASTTNADAQGALGFATPPGTEFNPALGDEQSVVVVNYEAYNPQGENPDGTLNPNAVVRGGFDFCTYVHELGHAIGLAHPHDTGGGSTIWPGVGQAFGDLGNLNLNQGVFTMMGYNDGWVSAPHGLSPSQTFGWQAGPMAIDIAALQLMYGANTSHRAGNDTYTLPGANQQGTFYSCIWDAGGLDTLLGAAGRANIIDLRPASLAAAPGASGFVSFAQGIHGGFTIASGVLIENARGGLRADVMSGNAAANALSGLGGNDALRGFAGNDALLGMAGDDRLTGDLGRDLLNGGAGSDDFIFLALSDSLVGAARDIVDGFARGADDIDLSAIDARAGQPGNQAFQLDQAGALGVGAIRQVRTADGVLLQINADADAALEMQIMVRGVPGLLAASDFIL